jgi:PPOX class probable F420-dependent enzyme
MMETEPQFLTYLQQAYYLWFTTVRNDGTPQPTPVWFLWENGTFLIYTGRDTQKLRNIQTNPRVALSYSDNNKADSYAVLTGEAIVDTDSPPVDQHPDYLRKYAEGIAGLGMTSESFAEQFSVALRVTPVRVRGE